MGHRYHSLKVITHNSVCQSDRL